MTTASTTPNSALSSLLSSLTNNGAGGTSTSGPLITTGQINVSQLVSELMVAQSLPLTRLQAQEASAQTQLSAYGQEQSALAALQTAANALALPNAFQAAAANVTGSGVTATVTGTPVNANYAITVTSLAQAQSLASKAQADATTAVGTGTLTIQPGAWSADNKSFSASSAAPITVTIDSSNDTLSGIAAAINSAAKGVVNASVVTDASGSRLVLSSANTGAANGFTVSAKPDAAATTTGLSQFDYQPAAQTMTASQSAADAHFTVNGLALTSASNVVTSAIAGLSLNLTQSGSSAQVQVATDPKAVTATVQSFIAAYNAFISLTGTLTAYNPTSNSSSALTGDSATRTAVGQLQSILGGQQTTAGSGPSWLAQVGITVKTDGTLALDTTQFQAALSANPSGVAKLFTAAGSGTAQGFAAQVSNAVTQILGSTGAIGSAQANLNSQITYMSRQQAALQAQLAQTQASLTQEYSALNAEISKAQAQQTSLANQLAALPG